jgi:hypothetical protein
MRMRMMCSVAGLAMMAGLALAGPVAAQIGAIGGAPGGAAAGSQATSRAPLFGESGMVMGRGAWSFGAYAGYTSGSVDFVISEVNFSYTQILVGGFYGVTDKATIGAILFPHNMVSIDTELGNADESGMGDAQLYGKLQLASSADGNTTVAAIANISLPIGSDGFGANGAILGLRGAVSHSLENVSLHGNFGVGFPTDDEDGETTLFFGGAAVFAASPTVGIGAELIGSSASFGGERFTTIDLAPMARFRVGQRAHIDAGLQFNVSSSFDPNPFDYALVAGFTIGR